MMVRSDAGKASMASQEFGLSAIVEHDCRASAEHDLYGCKAPSARQGHMRPSRSTDVLRYCHARSDLWQAHFKGCCFGTWLYPPPAAPPLMPNVGPWLGCLMQVTTFRPR